MNDSEDIRVTQDPGSAAAMIVLHCPPTLSFGEYHDAGGVPMVALLGHDGDGKIAHIPIGTVASLDDMLRTYWQGVASAAHSRSVRSAA